MGKGKLAKALQKEQFRKAQLEKQSKSLIRQKEIQKSKVDKKNHGKNKNHKLINERSCKPFEPNDNILLVGEGDYSFAVSIIKDGLATAVVTCTSYDSENEVLDKYETAKNNIEYLRRSVNNDELKNSTVLTAETKISIHFEIDATKMHLQKPLKSQLGYYDCIIFNFPHLGNSVKDQDRNILQHQKLILDYFDSAQELINPESGKIVVALFEGEPYDSWKIKQLAKSKHLVSLVSSVFDWKAFGHYNHRLTAKMGSTRKPQRSRAARFYVFVTKQYVSNKKKQTKKKENGAAERDSKSESESE